jgi:excisionase family DNA binding protein
VRQRHRPPSRDDTFWTAGDFMSTSPAPTTAASECRSDIFDQLSKCERLLTAKELAGMLAISPKTIYSYVERNMIPYYKIEANIRFRARDIANWLRDHGCSRLGVPEQTRPATTRAGAPAWR